MRAGEIETNGKYKDEYFLLLTGKEANALCEALEEYCEKNKRKRAIKKLLGEMKRFFVA